MQSFIHNEITESIATLQATLALQPQIEQVARKLKAVLDSGGKIIAFGNGGSAADAQHFAAELSGRYKKERKALAGISITTDTSALTAIGNDYGFEFVFSRQVEALAHKGDALFGISTRALAGISITTDTSALTAIGNDYGFEFVFSRQVEALAHKGDALFGISTSGNSANVLKAFEVGQKLGCYCVGLSGKGGGKMNELSENLVIPSDNTPRIQEAHILVIHSICGLLEMDY